MAPTEGEQPQNGRESRDDFEDPADTEALTAQTQNSCRVCAGCLSPPAGSTPDTEGLQRRGRKTLYMVVIDVPFNDKKKRRLTHKIECTLTGTSHLAPRPQLDLWVL